MLGQIRESTKVADDNPGTLGNMHMNCSRKEKKKISQNNVPSFWDTFVIFVQVDDMTQKAPLQNNRTYYSCLTLKRDPEKNSEVLKAKSY